MPPKRMKPEIALEFKDVSIEIKVCGVDLTPEDREYVKLFPELDTNKLTCRERVDAYRRLNKKERKRIPKFEYKLVPNHASDSSEDKVKVLPKLSCEHCGKTFSRKSTLEQHVASHDQHNTSWEEVQDAALHDLEQAAIFGVPGAMRPGGKQSIVFSRRSLESKEFEDGGEEQEIAPPKLVSHKFLSKNGKVPGLQKIGKKFVPTTPGVRLFKCNKCEMQYTDVGNLKRHIWAKHNNPNRNQNGTFSKQAGSTSINTSTPIKQEVNDSQYSPTMPLSSSEVHNNNMAKPFECDLCGWKFHLLHNMERHKSTHDKGRKAKVPPHVKEKMLQDVLNVSETSENNPNTHLSQSNNNIAQENDSSNDSSSTSQQKSEKFTIAQIEKCTNEIATTSNQNKTENIMKTNDSSLKEIDSETLSNAKEPFETNKDLTAMEVETNDLETEIKDKEGETNEITK